MEKNWQKLEKDILRVTNQNKDFGITEKCKVIPCVSMSNCDRCIFHNKELEDCNVQAKFKFLFEVVDSALVE